eukprot:10620958-Karenia_brevis.AAC.1
MDACADDMFWHGPGSVRGYVLPYNMFKASMHSFASHQVDILKRWFESAFFETPVPSTGASTCGNGKRQSEEFEWPAGIILWGQR